MIQTDALERYAKFGFDTIPLRPGTKQALIHGWPTIPPEQMWKNSSIDANIGIRAGGPAHLAIIDCDDKKNPETFENIKRLLDGVGYKLGSYPLIKTASGNGRHIYIRFEGFLSGNSRNLSEEFGTGEFRYGPGAYVVAPPSIVQGNSYTLLEGTFNRLPVLCVNDVKQLLKNPQFTECQIERKSENLHYIPKKTLLLLDGIGMERYRSRSEFDAAIITGLINAGFSFDEVLHLFRSFPCSGKYQEMRGNSGRNYLLRSYESTYEFALTHKSNGRLAAENVIDLATNRIWTGKTGVNDKGVFIAHASIAIKACSLEYSVSARQLAKLAGISPEAAMKATKRLCNSGYLQLISKGLGLLANTYRILSQSLTLPQSSSPCEEVSEFGTENDKLI